MWPSPRWEYMWCDETHISKTKFTIQRKKKVHAFQLNVKRLDCYTVLRKKRRTLEAIVSFSVSLWMLQVSYFQHFSFQCHYCGTLSCLSWNIWQHVDWSVFSFCQSPFKPIFMKHDECCNYQLCACSAVNIIEKCADSRVGAVLSLFDTWL